MTLECTTSDACWASRLPVSIRKGLENLGAGGLAKLQAPEAWFAAVRGSWRR